MSRYSRTTDIVVGTPLANRTHPELAGVVGYFVNTVALRTDLSGMPNATSPGLAHLVVVVRAVLWLSYTYGVDMHMQIHVYNSSGLCKYIQAQCINSTL